MSCLLVVPEQLPVPRQTIQPPQTKACTLTRNLEPKKTARDSNLNRNAPHPLRRHSPPPHRPLSFPVFGVGFPKTGTTALHSVFAAAGFRSAHEVENGALAEEIRGYYSNVYRSSGATTESSSTAALPSFSSTKHREALDRYLLSKAHRLSLLTASSMRQPGAAAGNRSSYVGLNNTGGPHSRACNHVSGQDSSGF